MGQIKNMIGQLQINIERQILVMGDGSPWFDIGT